jgi:hypothetical protein
MIISASTRSNAPAASNSNRRAFICESVARTVA